MENITDIFEQRMDRKEFLQYIGAGLAAVFGSSMIVKTLNSLHKPKTARNGYGASAYGGARR